MGLKKHELLTICIGCAVCAVVSYFALPQDSVFWQLVRYLLTIIFTVTTIDSFLTIIKRQDMSRSDNTDVQQKSNPLGLK